MQTILDINTQLSNKIPLYATASQFAFAQCAKPLSKLNKAYKLTNQKYDLVLNFSRDLKREVNWLISQSVEEILDILEEKLKIEQQQIDVSLNTAKARSIRILNQLKKVYLLDNYSKITQYNQALLSKARSLAAQYIIPLYITLKAITIVTKEMIMEMITERLGKLRMSYQFSKDTVTMIFSGDFKEEQVIKKLQTNIDSFKQLTVKFVQKGMEIKIPKKELFMNYETICLKLLEILNEVKGKGKQQLVEVKNKTLNIYNTVLERIKQKKIQISYKKIDNTPTPSATTQ